MYKCNAGKLTSGVAHMARVRGLSLKSGSQIYEIITFKIILQMAQGSFY
jgi:hypothetical protein